VYAWWQGQRSTARRRSTGPAEVVAIQPKVSKWNNRQPKGIITTEETQSNEEPLCTSGIKSKDHWAN